MITARNFIEQIHTIQRSADYAERQALTPYIVVLHNHYCEATNNTNAYIYENDPNIVSMVLGNKPAYDIFLDGLYADYHPSDNFFVINGCGHIETLTDTDIEEMYEWETWLEEEGDESYIVGDVSHISEVMDIVLHFNLIEEDDDPDMED